MDDDQVITDADIEAAKKTWLAEKDAGTPAETIAITYRFYENLVRGQALQIAAEFHRRATAASDPVD